MVEANPERERAFDIRGLSVSFPTSKGELLAIDDVSISVGVGECLGLVGESGSGKTLLASSLLGMVPPNARTEGVVDVAGVDMLRASRRQRDALRSHHLGLVMQDPTPSLNPIRRIASQLRESARAAGLPRASWDGAIDRCLREAELDPEVVRSKYPFELSGGMNQRVCIAMALVHSPKILIADEPTTALDVTTQAALLNTLARIRRERGMTVVFVSHDLAVVRQVADRIAVMYSGHLLEVGPAATVASRPNQPYTQALLGALPEMGQTAQQQRLRTIPGNLSPRYAGDTGCPFASRCHEVMATCHEEFPPESHVGNPQNPHSVWCWAR